MHSNKSRVKNSVLNIISILAFQMVTAISGLILPRLMIAHYGSDANGLVASITQFLSYIALLEAGAGGVIRAALYRPLAEGDVEKTSAIVVASRQFYRRIAGIFLIYLVGLCVVYPRIAKTEYSAGYIIVLMLILSLGTIMEYLFGLCYSTLITADQKSCIVNGIGIVALIANIIVTYTLVLLGSDLRVVKLVSCLIFAVKPLLYTVYVKRNYKLNMKARPNSAVISQRWNGLVHHIAFYIHTNTDMAILTLFMGTQYVSIYAVYNAVSVGIEKIVCSVSNGSAASIGNLLVSEDQKTINRFFDRFEFIQSALTTVLFATTALTLIPFVKVYTKNIADINYIYPLFGYLMVFASMAYCIRCIYSTISLAANRYKQTQFGAIAEAAINLSVSLIFVNVLGIAGIALGTLCGMTVRLICDIYYMSRNVVIRPIFKAVKLICVDLSIVVAAAVITNLIITMQVNTWIEWILLGMASFAVVVVVAVLFYFFFYRDHLIELAKMICSKFWKKM